MLGVQDWRDLQEIQAAVGPLALRVLLGPVDLRVRGQHQEDRKEKLVSRGMMDSQEPRDVLEILALREHRGLKEIEEKLGNQDVQGPLAPKEREAFRVNLVK